MDGYWIYGKAGGILKLDGAIIMIISDNNKPLDMVSNIIKIPYSKMVLKGERIGKRKALLNRWIYKRKFNNINFSEVINTFLDTLLQEKEKFINLKTEYEEIEIIMQIRSDYGQIGFTLEGMILEKINVLKIPLSFDILSFGLVEDDR